ncbi:MAG: bacillithiol biosynthesis protein BshC [Candidatus Thorarchaeota archaeon]
MNPSVVEVYLNYIWNDTNIELAKGLYDSPPLRIGDLQQRAPNLLKDYDKTGWHSDERSELLKKILIRINRKLGGLTPKVKINIEKISNGAIEAAHQSIVLGGPSFILNKAATAERLATLNSDENRNLVPFFCIADYDIVQPELTHVRTPLMGQRGNIVSIPVPKEYEFSPVSVLPIPDSDWLELVEKNIRDGYRPLFKTLDGAAKTLFEERLEEALAIIRWSFINSNTMGGWFQKILSRLLNIENNLGIPLIPASDEGIRDLFVPGIEFLLSRQNREVFLKAQNEATELILSNGFKTGTGRRKIDHVPFFYECPEKDCNSSRTELHYATSDAKALLTGKCPSCGQQVEIETSADTPDLHDYAQQLSPRVDTRQMIIDTTIPVVAHAGGPGETAYYAQVIPIAKALKIPFPMYVKYPRVFFNTPWNERLAEQLKEQELPVLHSGEMFSSMGKIARNRKKAQHDDMNDAVQELRQVILKMHSELNKSFEEIENQAKQTSGKEHKSLLSAKLDIERYLSWVFGQYTTGKNAQESSWSWIEWALNSGIPDMFGPYVRAYVPEMKNGATIFVNFSA